MIDVVVGANGISTGMDILIEILLFYCKYNRQYHPGLHKYIRFWMGEIGGQTDNNKRCPRQLHKGGMLRLEWIVEYFSFFSSSFEVYLKSSSKIKRIWIGVLSF